MNRFLNYIVDSRESTSDGLRRPMLLKKELKVDSNEEKKQLTDLLGEEEDDDIVIDDKSSDSDNFKPIKLNDRKFYFTNSKILIFKLFKISKDN